MKLQPGNLVVIKGPSCDGNDSRRGQHVEIVQITLDQEAQVTGGFRDGVLEPLFYPLENLELRPSVEFQI